MAAPEPPASGLRRLHNEDWGFGTSCFVCEPRNDAGLRIPFDHDPEREMVVAHFNIGPGFSGAPSYLHGGITLAVLDEAMAWACIAVAGKLAVTEETSARFRRPVLVGKDYSVEARITASDGERIHAAAEVSFAEGKVCAEATATFVVLGEAQALRATGAEPGTIDPSLLR